MQTPYLHEQATVWIHYPRQYRHFNSLQNVRWPLTSFVALGDVHSKIATFMIIAIILPVRVSSRQNVRQSKSSDYFREFLY